MRPPVTGSSSMRRPKPSGGLFPRSPELRNRRHEQYAQLRAGGKSKTDAYTVAYGCRVPKRASEGGIRVEKRPEVDTRIRELQQEIARESLKVSLEAAERQKVTREFV